MKIAKPETFGTEFLAFVRITADSGETGWRQVSTDNADITTQVFHRQIAPHAIGAAALDFADTLALIGEREHKYPGSYLRRAMAGADRSGDPGCRPCAGRRHRPFRKTLPLPGR